MTGDIIGGSDSAGDPNAELLRLVDILNETQQSIVDLTEGRIDAVVQTSGSLLLLPETQAHFRDEATLHQAFAAERNAILNALPVQVALIDSASDIRVVNRAWLAFSAGLDDRCGHRIGERYFDYWRAEKALGRAYADVVAEGIKTVLSRQSPVFTFEYCLSAHPSRPWFQLIVSPLAGDAASGAVIVHIDVTQQKLHEEQIRQMQRLDALGQLTGGVAHDFNNLLTVILGNAELLEQSLGDDEPRRSWAELVRIASEKAAALTNRLLAFARRQTLDPKILNVGESLVGMEMLLRRTIGEHVSIHLPQHAAASHVQVDPSQLENAIINLCINARDAMPTGGAITIDIAQIEVSAEKAASLEIVPGLYVVLKVSDTGHGMDEATLCRVFEPFFTTKEIGKGSGLGLSMVYGFLKQSKGAVTISSQPGKGTDVRLWLPSHSVSPVSVLSQAALRRPHAKQRILLAEDDDMVRLYVAQQLDSFGYRVIAVQTAHQALAVLESGEDCDLLFTDLIMPGGMTGLQLAAAAVSLRPGLRVLLTSGYAEALDEVSRDQFSDNLLAKPYKRDALAAKLDVVFSQTQSPFEMR